MSGRRLFSCGYQLFRTIQLSLASPSPVYSSRLEKRALYTSVPKMSCVKVVNFELVKSLKDNKDIMLIDVREPEELQETGILPGSINIPLGDVESALKDLKPNEFFKRYGRPQPTIEIPLVFSCRSGKRSEKASITAIKLGYKDVRNYSGGWLDWEQHNKK